MKKLIYVTLISLGILTTIGCGNKKNLECRHTTENSDYGTQEEIYNVSFEDDKITKQVVTTNIVLSEAVTQYKDDFFVSIKVGIDEANTKKGIKGEASLKDNKIKTKMIVTIKELDTESKNYIGIDDTQTYDNLKKDLTDNGYSCK